jgi:hypothetical protein
MLDFSLPLVLLGFASYYSDIVTAGVFFILKGYGIHQFQVTCDREITKSLIKRLETECSCTNTALTQGFKKTISGWIWNKKLVGYVSSDEFGNINKITIITRSSTFDDLIKPTEEMSTNFASSIADEPQVSCKLTVFYRYGSYEHINYSMHSVNLINLVPILDQVDVVKDIVSDFNKNKRSTVFIEGPPCSGKSSIGYLVSKEIGGVFCNTFNPTDPGDTLSNVIRSTRDWGESENTPLVILIDEIDILLKKIHNDNIRLNHKISTSVTDKQTWSKFMDNLRFHKNIILILTSNTSKADIDKMDLSYLRPGRVDKYHKLESPIHP